METTPEILNENMTLNGEKNSTRQLMIEELLIKREHSNITIHNTLQKEENEDNERFIQVTDKYSKTKESRQNNKSTLTEIK